MILTLDNTPSSGKPYTSGEYRTNAFYGYGTLEASIQAAVADGIVGGSLFFYTGPSDGNPWDEIDIEFVKGNLQTNYFTNGTGGHEKIIQLGFDPSKNFHTYKIEWRPDMIIWSVDGISVNSEDGSRGALPVTPGRIMANLWPGIGEDAWLGTFNYTKPITVEYDWIKYTPYSPGSSVPSTTESPVNKPYNYPNPFSDKTTISFEVPDNGKQVILKFYNSFGQLVKNVSINNAIKGENTYVWDGTYNNSKAPAGMYFCTMEIGDNNVGTIKMIVK